MSQSAFARYARLARKALAAAHRGPFAAHFNTPVQFFGRRWYVNERIIEVPFAHHCIPTDGRGKRMLDFGCTRSELSLQFASLGYEVTGVDLRPFPFDHPSVRFRQTNLLDLDEAPFDCIVSISVLEHVGLGAYGEERRSSDLERVAARLVELLLPGGTLVVTVPCGRPHHDAFLRSFAPGELGTFFTGLEPVEEHYYRREGFKYWSPCSASDVGRISNAAGERGLTGVNGLGCFAWRRPDPLPLQPLRAP